MRVAGRVILAIGVIMMIAGCGLAFWGSQEKKVGANATADPADTNLGNLEGGETLANNHIKIGPHYALYYGTVYSYRTSKSGSSKQHQQPEASQAIEYAFYPIVSKSNPDMQELEKLKAEFGDLENVPDDVQITAPTHFIVLVKTSRFKKIGDLPNDAYRVEDSIHGLVINEFSKLTEEKNLIKQTYPDIKFDKVLILEDGRTPKSAATATAIMVGGIAMLVVGILGSIAGLVMWIAGLAVGRR